MVFLDVDPSVVKPGWTPLIITIFLAAAIALLMISMRRQIRKISAPRLEDVDASATTSYPQTVDSARPAGTDHTDDPVSSDGTVGSDSTDARS